MIDLHPNELEAGTHAQAGPPVPPFNFMSAALFNAALIIDIVRS